MPKMEAESLTQKIGLDQIVDTGNIRAIEKYGPNKNGEFPKEIIELAESVKTIGQLQPVVLKEAGNKDGVKLYELIAGFRRRAAFQYLISQGLDYNRIDAIIKTGDKLTIQLVENIQREDLTAPEREAAIFQLAENGMKQVEIAAQLSKNKGYVSINISAYKMRLAGQKEGLDLTGIETSTLAEFLSVPENELIFVLRELIRLGGTRSAANILAAKYKKGKDAPPPEPAPDPSPVESSGGNEPPPDIDPLKNTNEVPAEPVTKREPEPIKAKPKTPSINKPDIEPIEADHRVIDVNIVLTAIYDYMKTMEKQIEGMPPSEKNKYFAVTKLEAAKDILALVHERLDNA